MHSKILIEHLLSTTHRGTDTKDNKIFLQRIHSLEIKGLESAIIMVNMIKECVHIHLKILELFFRIV